jgi:uncharacterized protein
LFAGLIGGAAALSLIPDVITGAEQRPAEVLRRDYPVQPVPFTDVHLTDEFWLPKIETNRTETIPFAFQQCERTGRVALFERAAKVLRGEPLEDRTPPGYPFDDTDVYKVIEGASYTLSVHPDPKLEQYVDGLIAKIAAAQEPDGYIYTTRTIDPKNPHKWAGRERWELERDDSHELYNLGHLYEAAVAHHLATGKRTLLDVAIKSANLLVGTFGPGRKSIWPGHQITEMALARLYRVTGDERYLTLAKFLLDERGPNPGEKVNPRGLAYNQAHQRVLEQTEPIGHAVRATYMYSGMADVAALTGDAGYVRAIDTIWENTVGRKLYITGGIGASGAGEAFGSHYELPNMTAYNETCASIGMDYWNHRLFLLHGDAKYLDVMERTLYNGLISGVSLDGKTFFYPNPLESNGQHERSPWFGVACCPSNITRFLASVPGYMYARKDDAIYINLFAAGSAELEIGGVPVKIAQTTRYPWDGDVAITIDPGAPRRLTLKVRIPGWAREQPVPSDLYRFLDAPSSPPQLKVNGSAVPVTVDAGYVTLAREWRAGDRIDLNLPMPVRRIVAHDSVEADRGRVALQRGPVVFAAEWPDNPNGRVRNLVLNDRTHLTSEFRPNLLNGVHVVTGRATALSYDEKGNVTKTEQTFMAIPYYAWANRGRGQMIVWIPRADAHAKPAPYPTIATTSTVTASSGRKNPRLINDGEQPASSDDPSSYFDWWPARGTTEWAEMTFAKPQAVSEAGIYWFDDTGHGQVRVPASWRILYKDGDAWKPVDTPSPYGKAKDAWNKVTFATVTTPALRVEVTMQPKWSAGIQEWKVK